MADQKNNSQKEDSAKKTDGWIRQQYKRLRKFLNITETRKAIVRNDLLDSSAPREEFYALIVFACAIATFGLIANSEVVTIGSQLVDPLIFPILGLSIATTSGLQHMFRRASQSILWGMVISVVMSSILSFVFYRLPYGPNADIPNTILTRTTATLIDLGIALAGGSAAAYAMAHPRLEGTIPGVAIATALMPPLCTAGFGIAFFDGGIFLGAVLQFLTNLTAILFAGIATFSLLGFNPLRKEEGGEVTRKITASLIVVTVITGLLAFFTWNTVSDARKTDQIQSLILEGAGEYADVQLIDLSIFEEGGISQISAILRSTAELSESEVKEIQENLSAQLGRDVELEIIAVRMQVIQSNQ